jgi:hypothetical protein
MQKAPLLLVFLAALALACMPAAQSVSLTASPSSVPSGFASTFVASVSGGTAPYTYIWQLPNPPQGVTIGEIPGSCGSDSATCQVYGTSSTSSQFTVSVFVKDANGADIGPTTSPAVTIAPYQCILGTAGDLGSCIAYSMPVAAVGILLSLSFVAIAYMLGEVLKLEGLSSWYKTELWETTKSMLIIATIYGVLVMASSISTAFASTVITQNGGTFVGAGPCAASSLLTTNLCMLYQNVYAGYLTTQLQGAYTSFAAIFGLSMGAAALGSITLNTWFGVDILPPIPPAVTFLTFKFGSYNVKIFASNYLVPLGGTGYSLLKDVMTIVVLPMILLLQFQYDLLPTIIVLGLVVFVPMGIMLRAIPFLRPIGGTLIAIGITVSLIYPMLMLVLNLPVTNYFNYVFTSASSSSSCSGSDLICNFFQDVSQAIDTAINAVPIALMGDVLGSQNAWSTANIQAYNNGANVGLDNVNSIFPAINFITDNTSNLVLQFVLFFLDMIIALIAANTIAKPLGGSVKLGLGKFKLV